MAPKLSTSTIGYKSITVRFACGMLHARHNDAPRRGQAGNADRTFDASKQSPSYYSVLLHSFYFLLSSLFNYTVRLMAPGMRVCKKKKITSARLNNYSPFTTTTSHHHSTSHSIIIMSKETNEPNPHCVRLRLNCNSSNRFDRIKLGLLTLRFKMGTVIALISKTIKSSPIQRIFGATDVVACFLHTVTNFASWLATLVCVENRTCLMSSRISN